MEETRRPLKRLRLENDDHSSDDIDDSDRYVLYITPELDYILYKLSVILLQTRIQSKVEIKKVT